jgi:hypothetical protein
MTMADLRAYKRALGKKGVSAQAADQRLAQMMPTGERQGMVPKGHHTLGSARRREVLRAGDQGPASEMGKTRLAVVEWIQRAVGHDVPTRGRWHLPPGRVWAMEENMRGRKGADNVALGRMGIRAALVLVLLWGGGAVGIVETACCRLRNGYSRWVHDAMVWAEKRGWIRWEVMMRFMEEADKHVVRVSSQRSTLLEVGLGWGGFEEGARRVLDRLGIRHVGLDRAAHKIGSREDPDELGHTLPELLGDITSGKERGLVQWCMKRAQFDVEALLGVFISMDCVEETGAAHMPGGRHYKGEPRSEQQEDTVDTVVAAVKWLQSNRPRVSIVLEQPKSSALVDDPRMVGLGLRTVAVDGCAYGLFHRKGYHLWMTMGEDEFVPRVTKEHCLYCEMGMKHPPGMIPPKGSWQSRVRWEGYSIDAARNLNRMPVLLGEELAEAMVLAWERRG